MSSSNSCFLTWIQISQEAGQVVWFSHLFQNFPQFVVIHTVKGFGVISKAEGDVLLELSCFFYDPTDVGNLISGSSALSKASLNIWKLLVHVLLKPSLDWGAWWASVHGITMSWTWLSEHTYHLIFSVVLSAQYTYPSSKQEHQGHIVNSRAGIQHQAPVIAEIISVIASVHAC